MVSDGSLIPQSGPGSTASGAFRAAVNLIMPMLQAIGALSTLLIPTFSRRRKLGQRTQALRFTLMISGLCLAYWLILTLWGSVVVDLVYDIGNPQLVELLPILALVPFATGLIAVLQGLLLSAERADQLFWTHVCAAIVTLTLGVALSIHLDLRGAAIGMAAAYGAQVLAISWFLARGKPAAHASDT